MPSSSLAAERQRPLSILEIVIDCRTLALGHALLLAVHLCDLTAACCFVRLLVITDLDETRESEADALLAAWVHTLLAAGLVARTQRQVGCPDFPDITGLEPDVRLVLASRAMRIEGLGTVNDDLAQLRMKFLEDCLGETCTDVANRLIRVRIGVVASQEEGTVH